MRRVLEGESIPLALIYELLLLLFLHCIGFSDLICLLSSDHSILRVCARALCDLLLLFLMFSVAYYVVWRRLLLPVDRVHALELVLEKLLLYVLKSVLLIKDLGLIPQVLLVLLVHEPPDYVLILLLALQESHQQPLSLILGQMFEVELLLLDAAAGLGLISNSIEYN